MGGDTEGEEGALEDEDESGVDKPSFQSGVVKIKDALLSKLGEYLPFK